jgi:hypothetical protein
MDGLRPLYQPTFGRSLIIGEPAGTYQPNPDGAPAVILGAADRAGELIDLVAWHPHQPGRWWLRTGAAVALGEVEIDRAGFLDLPLLLFATPSAWLWNHDREGRWPAACILDWSADPRLIFTGVKILCDTPALAERLEQAQRRHDRPLRISVDRSAARAA